MRTTVGGGFFKSNEQTSSIFGNLGSTINQTSIMRNLKSGGGLGGPGLIIDNPCEFTTQLQKKDAS